MRKKITLTGVMALMLFSQILFSLPINNNGKSPFVDVVKNIRESVVNIRVEGESKTQNSQVMPFDDDMFKFFFGPNQGSRKFVAKGTGFIFKKDKDDVYILTNNHVVENGKNGEIIVTLADKVKYDAEIVGLDPKSDLAVIKISVKKNEKIVVAKLGNSDNLEIGDWAIAIGNPFGQGLERTVTVGVISATGRSNLNFGSDSPIYQDYIQTDAAINPGNSGGPLLNINGEVIGINAAITSRSGGNNGIGFAIPVDLAKKVSSDLINTGRVIRAYLGILPQEVTADMQESLGLDEIAGVLVAKVEEDTPAEKAGLKNGDVILEFNNEEIENVSKFRLAVSTTKVGEKTSIKIIRKGKQLVLKAVLDEFPNEEISQNNSDINESFWLGLSVSSLKSDFAYQNRIKISNGVVINKIEENSPASKSNLKVGDIIQEINYQEINNVKDYKKVMKALEKSFKKGKNKVLLFYVISTNGHYHYVPVSIK